MMPSQDALNQNVFPQNVRIDQNTSYCKEQFVDSLSCCYHAKPRVPGSRTHLMQLLTVFFAAEVVIQQKNCKVENIEQIKVQKKKGENKNKLDVCCAHHLCKDIKDWRRRSQPTSALLKQRNAFNIYPASSSNRPSNSNLILLNFKFKFII